MNWYIATYIVFYLLSGTVLGLAGYLLWLLLRKPKLNDIDNRIINAIGIIGAVNINEIHNVSKLDKPTIRIHLRKLVKYGTLKSILDDKEY